MKDIPRITIAAVRGGAGKTIASLGIVSALKDQGLKVAPFKKGPDYIDAGWLSAAGKRPCYNLDPYLMSEKAILGSFLRRTQNADIAVIEGNRGIFDGMDEKGTCSTAELSRLLRCPVILTMDCTKSTRTVAAVLKGCLEFESGLLLKGVILNRIAGPRHQSVIIRAIETYTGLSVIGTLPRLKDDPLPMRHLGLLTSQEHSSVNKALEKLAQLVKKNLDMDLLIKTAKDAPPLSGFEEELDISLSANDKTRPDIGVIRDEAFQFFYPENLEAMESAGGRLVFLDAIRDQAVPMIDALYIPGGFPETQAGKLASNKAFMSKLRKLIEKGLPVYAECGGVMYLGRHIIWNNKKYPMLGIIGWDFIMEKRPVGHGYSILKVVEDNPFYKKEDIIKGHEFHYSLPKPVQHHSSGVFSSRVERGFGFDGKMDGITLKGCFGAYTHVHALSDPLWGKRIVSAAHFYKNLKNRVDKRKPHRL